MKRQRQREIQQVQFTYNLKPFLLVAVKGDRVLARRILLNGQPSIRVTEFSRKMVEAAINRTLDEAEYGVKVATPSRR